MAGWLLLFDVGNTTIKVGLAPVGQAAPLVSYVLPTDPAETPDSLGLKLLHLAACAGCEPGEVAGAAACSVVPPLESVLDRACRRFFGRGVDFAARELAVPLENRYARPQEVGADRLVGVYAARIAFPAEAHIVVDFGTATTFDCGAGGAYLGGLICPGVLSSVRALATGTARLPQISLEVDSLAPDIGRSTSQSLNQGVVFGFAAMVEGLLARLRPLVRDKAWGAEPVVIAVGGFAERLARVTDCFDAVRADLVLEGVRLLWESGRNRNETSGL